MPDTLDGLKAALADRYAIQRELGRMPDRRAADGSPVIQRWSLAIGWTAVLCACNAVEPLREPRIVVQPDSVMVTLEEGSSATTSRSVTVTNAGPDSLTGLDAAITYREAQDGGWVAATLASTTAPTALGLKISVGGLAAGAHEAAVVVRSPDAANDSAVVHVICGVTVSQCAGPVMCLSSTRLTFTSQGGSTPPAQAVGVYSCGCGRVIGLHTSVTYEEPGLPRWLAVKKSTWRTPAALSVQTFPALMAPGSYHGTVVVSADTASNSPRTIDVVLNVQ